MQPSGLTWIATATERAERAVSKLKWAHRDPDSKWTPDLLSEAADELRTALNLCEDSIRSIRNGGRADPKARGEQSP